MLIFHLDCYLIVHNSAMLYFGQWSQLGQINTYISTWTGLSWLAIYHVPFTLTDLW